jgi:hypothetical protein
MRRLRANPQASARSAPRQSRSPPPRSTATNAPPHPGTLIIADDTVRFADETRDYLDHVQDPANGYTTVEIPLDEGLILSARN